MTDYEYMKYSQVSQIPFESPPNLGNVKMTKEEMILGFIRFTNQSREYAESYLRMFNWDYKAATDVYWRNYIAIY